MSSCAPPDATCSVPPWLHQAWVSGAIPGSPLASYLTASALAWGASCQPHWLSPAPYPLEGQPKLPSLGIHLESNHGKGQHPSRPVASGACRGRPGPWACSATTLRPAFHSPLLALGAGSSSIKTLFSVVQPPVLQIVINVAIHH